MNSYLVRIIPESNEAHEFLAEANTPGDAIRAAMKDVPESQHAVVNCYLYQSDIAQKISDFETTKARAMAL